MSQKPGKSSPKPPVPSPIISQQVSESESEYSVQSSATIPHNKTKMTRMKATPLLPHSNSKKRQRINQETNSKADAARRRTQANASSLTSCSDFYLETLAVLLQERLLEQEIQSHEWLSKIDHVHAKIHKKQQQITTLHAQLAHCQKQLYDPTKDFGCHSSDNQPLKQEEADTAEEPDHDSATLVGDASSDPMAGLNLSSLLPSRIDQLESSIARTLRQRRANLNALSEALVINLDEEEVEEEDDDEEEPDPPVQLEQQQEEPLAYHQS